MEELAPVSGVTPISSIDRSARRLQGRRCLRLRGVRVHDALTAHHAGPLVRAGAEGQVIVTFDRLLVKEAEGR